MNIKIFENNFQKFQKVGVRREILTKKGKVASGDAGEVTVTDGLFEFAFGERRYQIREITDEAHRLRVNVRAVRGERFHVDVSDLYVHKTRKAYANACGRLFEEPTGVIEKDICSIIDYLEKSHVRRELGKSAEAKDEPKMTPEEEAEAMAFLKSPNLLDEVSRHLDLCGYVGEPLNKKIGYLITLSRRLDSPLSGAIISNSGAGKSRLMEHLAAFTPEEETIFYTRITPQALYYKPDRSLKHKLVISAEAEGLKGADYSIRELISSKVLRMATPVKDPLTGRMTTVEYEVEGPIALLFSTTQPAIEYENATRFFILSLDESPGQTQKIHAAQRTGRTLSGWQSSQETARLRKLHKNSQRLLKPYLVINPYAASLEFPHQCLRTRREHEKYLTLIDAIAYLYQHQREVKFVEHGGTKVPYIEVSLEDIATANALMIEILRQDMAELKKPSRELLGLVRKMVDEKSEKEAIRAGELKFNRRDVREYTGWSDQQIKVHIRQLEELQFLNVATGGRGKMYKYELGYPAEALELELCALVDVERLRTSTTSTELVLPGSEGLNPAN